MFWAQQEAMRLGLDPTASYVLVSGLAYHANEVGECWPSVEQLMVDTRLGRRTLQRALGRIAAWPADAEEKVLTSERRPKSPTIWSGFPQPKGANVTPSRAPNLHPRAPNLQIKGATVTPEPNKENRVQEPVAAFAQNGRMSSAVDFAPGTGRIADWAQPTPECERCDGTGWVATDDGKVARCPH